VRNLEGALADLLAAAKADPQHEDYLRIILTDDGALLNVLGRLREAYPNLLQLERRFLRRDAAAGGETGASANAAQRRDATEVELFAGFFREVVGNSPDASELALFHAAVEELRRDTAELAGSPTLLPEASA
jgi:exonuclease SbcD